jgi:hypothetical protein
VLCAGSTLLLVEDAPTSVVNGALARVSQSKQASPSEVWLFSTGSINLSFILRERLATVLIIPSSWGSQLGGYFARITMHTIILLMLLMYMSKLLVLFLWHTV